VPRNTHAAPIRVSIALVVDARFSTVAALACLTVAVLSALGDAWAVAIVFGLLAGGFAVRALQGYRRRGR
jgi:hypothetical protein